MSTCEGGLTGGPQGALLEGLLSGGPFTRLSSASREADALVIRPLRPSLPAKCRYPVKQCTSSLSLIDRQNRHATRQRGYQ